MPTNTRCTAKSFQKIVAEVASYAKTHNIMVVRRIDTTEPTQATTARVPTEANLATDLYLGLPTTSAQPEPSSPVREPWDQDLIYVVDRDAKQEIDISDEIVKRLNAADAKEPRTK